MPGLFAVFGNQENKQSDGGLLETIDPFLSNERLVSEFPGCKIGISWLTDNLLGKSVCSEDNKTAGFFCGDLIGYSKVPWVEVIENLRKENYRYFKSLKGTFIFAVYDKESGTLHLISDRLSMHPAYYHLSGNNFIFSTNIPTFCKLIPKPVFSREWLYEFIYFNYGLGEMTPLSGVKRIPPSSVLSVRFDGMKFSLNSYAEAFSRPLNLLKGRRGMEKALDVFSKRLPEYYSANGDMAVSLTAGLDSRTVLSFSPEKIRERVLTYTYGIPGCYDLLEAADVAESLGFRHREIHFDEEFIFRLGELIRETVFLSGGLEKAHRATLLHVYRTLTSNGKRFPVTLTGLSGDHLFRDHIKGRGNVPAIISSDMMSTLQTGKIVINSDLYSGAFSKNYNDFKYHIHQAIDNLSARYGELGDPAGYIRYLVYEAAPKYFGGEYAVASHFTVLRSPFWDPEIISLAFSIEYGALGFSETLPGKDAYREKVLQGYLIDSVEKKKKSKIGGIPISAFSSNSKILYNAMKVLWKLPIKIRRLIDRQHYLPLEDWRGWLFSAQRDDVNQILGDNLMLSDYISIDFINRIKQSNDVILLGKLITAETILRLIDRNWVKPDSGVEF